MENIKILIIEDNKMNMKLVRSLLQLKQFEVIEAEDGEKGIKLAAEQLPNLILMDIQLPGIDGLTATSILKKNPLTKHIPVVALTSHAMRGDAQKARGAGCEGYITKPIDTRLFIDNIMQYLQANNSDNGLPKQIELKNVIEEKKPDNKSRCAILIVDDELRNIKLMTAILAAEPYEVLQATNGEQALLMINSHKIDLVLLDVMMPGINGFEVTQLIKNNPKTKHIPIILVTALDGQENKQKAKEAGADEFLTKPVNRIELITRIKSMLQLKQCQEQLDIHKIVGEKLAVPQRVFFSESQNSNNKQTGHQTVLLVEDDYQQAKLIKLLVADEPYNLIVASTGEEAIRLGQKIKIDLILLDLMLPDMNGCYVCEHYKNNQTTRNVQIVAITSLSDLESKIKCLSKGVDDYLIKPVNIKEVKSRINMLLKKKINLDYLQIHQKEILNLAIVDGLTGLYNQTYLKNYLQLELERSQERGYLVALMMLDLDDFKKYNDMLGHPAGDRILRKFSDLIKINIREIDLPARYGGEEFSVVMPYASKKEAVATAEKICRALQNSYIVEDEKNQLDQITTSIGIAICPKQAITVDSLIEKADSMLYHAKKTGKNKICYWD
ncbi:MAG TPA: response regulator [Candidatus Competibacter sp.]|nr:response regulator [Candidatus Competibacter sp.]